MNALVGHQHRPALIGTLSLLAASSIFLFAALRKKKKKENNEKNNDSTNKKRHRRRISFTSVGLGVGSFPPSANVKEPIINAAIYFDNADLPLTKDVARIIVEPLLAYERLSHVPDLDERVCRPSERRGKGKDGEAATAATGVIDPADMIRVLAVKGDEDLVNRTILEHCQDPLGEGRDDLPWWEILVIRNGSGSGPSACVVRVHHVIGDGLALVAAFDRILTKEDGTPIRSRLFQSRTISSASDAAGSKTKKKKKGILSTIWSLAEATGHCLTLAATRYDDDTAFSRMNHARMKHSGRREAVIFPTVPLDFVKELKTAAGGGATVNDVLTTAVSQAIRDYCISRDDEVLAKGGNRSDAEIGRAHV